MNMSFSSDQVFSLSPSVIVTEVDGESVLLDSSNGQYFGLNDTGTYILNLIEKQQPYVRICKELALKYPENSSDINADVYELLTNLLSKKLISRL